MDEFDANLFAAWQRVSERLRGDPEEAWRRARRTVTGCFRWPPRVWCLMIRASDTRWLDHGIEVSVDVAGSAEAQEIFASAAALKDLCAPVHLPWPGVPLGEAAARLGRHRESLRHWLPVRPGRSREVRSQQAPPMFRKIEDPACPLIVYYEKAQCHGHRGVDVPVVWSRGPLNPGASRGAPPHALWGTLWQYMTTGDLAVYEAVLVREPRLRPYRGQMRHRGWDWLCPGLHGSCGRRVQTLYAPLPPATIDQWLGSTRKYAVRRPASETPTGHSREGWWMPGEARLYSEQRPFACDRCWHLRGQYYTCPRGWNEVVTYISGGLLYGHEVEQPPWFRYERKR